MPGRWAADLYAAVQARQPALADRVVFMTGAACNDEARRFLLHVDRPCLDKPIARGELLALLAASRE
jgi:hypothetical protein